MEPSAVDEMKSLGLESSLTGDMMLLLLAPSLAARLFDLRSRRPSVLASRREGLEADDASL
jgi:hypothetical protein